MFCRNTRVETLLTIYQCVNMSAYNTAEHASLGAGITPYYASWGFHPRNLAWRTLEPKKSKNPTVEEFVTHQQEVLVQVKDALYQAQQTMEEFANRGKNDI